VNDDRGLEASPEFRAYISRLRANWPRNTELEAKHGLLAGNGHSSEIDMSASNSDENAQLHETTLGRRRFMQATAATAAMAAAGGVAAKASDDLNYGSELVQNPFIASTVSVAEVDQGANSDSIDEEMEALDYIADDGTVQNLSEQGGQIAEREDESTPHNPVTLQASKFDTEEFYSFPRGEEYDSDSDGEDDSDLDVLDATHWSTDTSGSAGSMTVEDADSPANSKALRVSTSSQGSGDTALATFSDFSITDGLDRKHLQLVLDVDTLESGVTVGIRAKDSDGDYREVTIDPSADTSNTGVVANATTTSKVYQVELGQLSTVSGGNGDGLQDYDEIEIAVSEANADITLYGFNIERESRWTFGSQEYTNSDDELDTQSVEEPTGTFSITGLDTLPDVFSSATLRDVEYEVEFQASGLPSDQVDFTFKDAPKYSYKRRFEVVYGWDLPSAYDLSYASESLEDEVVVPGSRFVDARFASGVSELPELSDVEDIDWTDRSDKYGSIGDDIVLSDVISAGNLVTVHFDYQVSSDEESSMTASGAALGPAGGAGGGIFGMLFSLPGLAVTGIAALIARARGLI